VAIILIIFLIHELIN